MTRAKKEISAQRTSAPQVEWTSEWTLDLKIECTEELDCEKIDKKLENRYWVLIS